MDARQHAAMAEATTLTRQGRLAEATALIQRNLAVAGQPWAMPRRPNANGGRIVSVRIEPLTRTRSGKADVE